ncbi:hypothetical protein [Paracidobacterium acidisoli]|uniref:Uncharacterized protein n=1 Tax=Paracidobacterium acidisoli TaxID=2303751 RepID=A0A372IJE9_9BACT|nr:hypothetical protein [Paracidobacterium acidisoli]MBT9333224.1 hypothetical protein [Paracidobacterium acidisoli]
MKKVIRVLLLASLAFAMLSVPAVSYAAPAPGNHETRSDKTQKKFMKQKRKEEKKLAKAQKKSIKAWKKRNRSGH